MRTSRARAPEAVVTNRGKGLNTAFQLRRQEYFPILPQDNKRVRLIMKEMEFEDGIGVLRRATASPVNRCCMDKQGKHKQQQQQQEEEEQLQKI